MSNVGEFSDLDIARLGLKSVEPNPKCFLMPTLDGNIAQINNLGEAKEASSSIFLLHAASNRDIRQTCPPANDILIKDEENPGYRQRYVINKLLYPTLAKLLEDNLGTGIVNVHQIQSQKTGQVTIGLYAAIGDMPERIVDFDHGAAPPNAEKLKTMSKEERARIGDGTIQRIRDTCLKRISQGIAMGVNPAGGLGCLGALLGIKQHTEALVETSPIPITNGNYLTGAAIARSIIEAVEAYIAVFGRQPCVSIIGATGTTGMITAAFLANSVCRNLLLVATEKSQVSLDRITNCIRLMDPTIHIETLACVNSANIAAQRANICTILTSSASLKIDVELCQRFGVFIDAGRPRSMPENALELRPDLTIDDGPTFRIPGKTWHYGLLGLRDNELLGCMTQAAVLALLKVHERPPMNPALNPTRFDFPLELANATQLYNAALEHGFTLYPDRQWQGRYFNLLTELATKKLAA